MPRGNSAPVSRRRFASARSSRCSTTFGSMKRQPAARCSGLSAFCAAGCTNESISCPSTDVLESRLTRSKLDSTSKKNSAKCLATSLRIELLKGSHVPSVQRLSVQREVPLHAAQFDVWPGVVHDAAKFLRNVLWCTIKNQEERVSARRHQGVVHVCQSRRSCPGERPA